MALKTELQIPELLRMVETAGQIVLAYANANNFKVHQKADHSPVTSADIDSNQFFIDELSRLSTYPVISEEAHSGWEQAIQADAFWLLDPLDGTQAFVNRSKEYSINLALVDKSGPRLGIIHAPALGDTWYAERGKGAFHLINGQTIPMPEKVPADCVLAKSKLHDVEEAKKWMKLNEIRNVLAVSSAIKFGYVAMGTACVYLRYCPSSEWDTAAGHIIVKEAGGGIKTLPSKKEPTYLQRQFKNGAFIAFSKGVSCRSFVFPAQSET